MHQPGSPEHNKALGKLLALVALGLSAALFVIGSLAFSPTLLDDGIQLGSALFVLRGQTPNVDFYSTYPPLNAYLLAAAFRAFGESIAVYRCFQTAAGLVTLAAVVFTCRRRLRGLRLTLFTAVLLIANLRLAELQSVTGVMWMTLAACAYIEATQHGAGHQTNWWSVSSGVFLGICAMTRLNFALYAAAAIGLDLIFNRQSKSAPLRAVSVAYVALPAVVITSLLLALWGGPPVELLRQVIAMTSQALADYALYPVQPAPSLDSFLLFANSGLYVVLLVPVWLAITASDEGNVGKRRLYTWCAALLFTAALALGAVWSTKLPILVAPVALMLLHYRKSFPAAARESFFVLSLLVFQMHYLLSRPDELHYFALFPPLALLVSTPATTVRNRSFGGFLHAIGSLKNVSAPLAAVTILAALELARGLSHLPANIGRIHSLPMMIRSDDRGLFTSCAGWCDADAAALDELKAAKFVHDHSHLSEPVFSASTANKRTMFNSARAYWHMRRPIGSRYMIMMKGMTTTELAETQMISDLKTRDVRWLLLWSGGLDEGKSTTPASVFDRFVRERYSVLATFGSYQVWGAKRAATGSAATN